ncbi:Pimeloyl-ACP methyl ester carboxylesterase [Muriicola jejuensis]|uniref:Proline iminopeptidase n=1 Tax=Muriicola jejuensis TaxID=504488 RepID=A0A6P0UEP6_9FLAO|nr:alpha/beta hydrolase [Muriicola jejuensis]NER11751.1 alpha/beta fold hydrolase [Muriicola jejuensis]SMP27716.1 Pimeloyl-ACP methyl ester carboxylesterase [Muriicola jejuensis]
MKRIFKQIGRIILYLIAGIVAVTLVLLLVIKIYSSEDPEPIVDNNGNDLPNSIAIIKDTIINGASQRLTIRGNDTSNPVLLRIHGGPGEFHMPQFYKFTGNDLEDLFTVCYWDQRGAGPAYSESLSKSSITLTDIVKDGRDISKYLIKKFGKEKIYLEGNSWGTVVGAFMVKENPELFRAYFGVGQMSNSIENEILSYDFALNESTKNNDTVSVQKLNKIGAPPYTSREEATNAVPIQRSVLVKYATNNLHFSNSDLMKLILLYDGWSMGFKWKTITQGQYGISAPILWKETMTDLNLIDEVSEWPIPVYIFQGSEDHFTETSLAKTYFDSIKAPTKEFYLFEGNGHMASAENPKKYHELIKQILEKKE